MSDRNAEVSTPPALFDAPPPPKPLGRRLYFIVAFGVLVLWSGSVACLWTSESSLVFRAGRSRARLLPPPDGLLALTTADGMRLDAIALTHDTAPRYWILFCPPSAGSIHGRVRRHVKALHAAGYNVLAFDYRGFGRNPGLPSEPGVYEDALTAYRHLTDARRVEPEKIILAGRSLGSAVAVELATRVPAGGLLLLSAIDSVPATASRWYPWAPVSWLATLQFDSLAKAPHVRVPVLQVHAPTDWLVPIEAARALFDRFPGRKSMLELPGGHNNVGFDDDALGRALAEIWGREGGGVTNRESRIPDP